MTHLSDPPEPAEWEIWTSAQEGVTTWWATRKRLLTESEIREGLVHTLRAETEAGLSALLVAQSPVTPATKTGATT
ncbi:hypothetical protein [Actinomadura sp. 9N215]|uniref:hypothetical protein n=1 Tax=Actinomadura sp. 9N215 TaxID=3375150 RepID=UPI0037BB7DBF